MNHADPNLRRVLTQSSSSTRSARLSRSSPCPRRTVHRQPDARDETAEELVDWIYVCTRGASISVRCDIKMENKR